jgi:hypothetical protein
MINFYSSLGPSAVMGIKCGSIEVDSGGNIGILIKLAIPIGVGLELNIGEQAFLVSLQDMAFYQLQHCQKGYHDLHMGMIGSNQGPEVQLLFGFYNLDNPADFFTNGQQRN